MFTVAADRCDHEHHFPCADDCGGGRARLDEGYLFRRKDQLLGVVVGLLPSEQKFQDVY